LKRRGIDDGNHRENSVLWTGNQTVVIWGGTRKPFSKEEKNVGTIMFEDRSTKWAGKENSSGKKKKRPGAIWGCQLVMRKEREDQRPE